MVKKLTNWDIDDIEIRLNEGTCNLVKSVLEDYDYSSVDITPIYNAIAEVIKNLKASQKKARK